MLDRHTLLAQFKRVRGRTEALTSSWTPEDQLLQAFPDASPTKWHRAHTTWFFAQFALSGVDDETNYLWNSYYDAVSTRHPRAQRGLLSRPDNAAVTRWRREIDARVEGVLTRGDDEVLRIVGPIVELGCHHEEQHQELMLTDLLAALVLQPGSPTARPASTSASLTSTSSSTSSSSSSSSTSSSSTRQEVAGGLVEIGHRGGGFAFDNEGPRHKVFLAPYALAQRPITNGDVRAFVDDGGYARPGLWLAAGFAWAQARGRALPAYLRQRGATREGFGVDGWVVVDDAAPAAHLSYYEADAIARFLGGRLPTEAEWEHACARVVDDPVHVDGAGFDDPAAAALAPRARDAPGEVWEWTSSSYAAYPGYRAADGALGEYNGKFMVGQYVLRGGSAFTPRGHARGSYRNFWPPETTFQLTGARVAWDLE